MALHRHQRSSLLPSHGAYRRGGFSFTEILFAMMILGIGFIMVAALFPVGIRQTQEVVVETTGASVAKSGASYMARVGPPVHLPASSVLPSGGNLVNFPSTQGKVVAYTGPAGTDPLTTVVSFWQTLSGNLILPTDPRYAWVPVYSRNVTVPANTPFPYAQVTIVAVQVRNTPTFSSADLSSIGTYAPNLQARPLTANFTAGGTTGPDTIKLGPSGMPDYTLAAGEGTFVIVGDDSATPNRANGISCNGYVYRIGNQKVNASGALLLGTWELMPANDMKNSLYSPCTTWVSGAPTTTAGTVSPGVQVFIVGKGYADPASGNTSFVGQAMDIACFSTFINVK